MANTHDDVDWFERWLDVRFRLLEARLVNRFCVALVVVAGASLLISAALSRIG